MLTDAPEFLDNLFRRLADQRVDVSRLQMDHLCYRVSDQAGYERAKSWLASRARLLAETPIAGRPIATFRLDDPLEHAGRKVRTIEVPAPKAGRPYREGFEHAEFVIDSGFEAFRQRAPGASFGPLPSRPGLNPELELELGGGVRAKFHHLPLEAVIAVESVPTALLALDQLGIWTRLNEIPGEVLVSGSLPLELGLPGTELDILVGTTERLGPLATRLFIHLAYEPTFNLAAQTLHGVPSLVARMRYGDLKIRLVAQEGDAAAQWTHRHLRVEARILGLAGNATRERVIAEMRNGHGIEDAFCRVLELETQDPDRALLACEALEEVELKDWLQSPRS